MTNWAIVIGIDKYADQKIWLKAAVQDALRMRNWLLDPHGGNVPSKNLFMLISPRPDSRLPTGLDYKEPTRQGIIDAVRELADQSNRNGYRLYFYFAGHGISGIEDFNVNQAIVPSDFGPISRNDTGLFLEMESITDYLQAFSFSEEYIILDACRNIPWKGRFRTGKFPDPPEEWYEDIPSPPSQYILYATTPGSKAREINEIGNEYGAFTKVLLDGLKGKGSAKTYDSASDRYFVTMNSLFKYVEEEMENRRLVISNDDTREIIQKPKRAGEIGGKDPTFAAFDSSSFEKQKLSVFIDPSEASEHARLFVTFGRFIEDLKDASTLPVEFSLMPGDYGVRAWTPNYRPEEEYWIVKLYDKPEKKIFKFLAKGPSERRETFEEFLVRLPLKRRDAIDLSEPSSARITLWTVDKIAPLEIADIHGKVLSTGLGEIYTPVQPGIYQARLITPEGQAVSQQVVVEPGTTKDVEIAPPKPLEDSRVGQDLISLANFNVKEEVTDMVGPMGVADLSTILTLAGAAASSSSDTWRAEKLRSIGLESFKNATGGDDDNVCGVQILFGIDTIDRNEAKEYLSKIKLRFWPIESPIPASTDSPKFSSINVEGLGEFARRSIPGAYWLSIQLPEQNEVIIQVTLLIGRITLLIFNRTLEGQVKLFQYMPAITHRADPMYFEPSEKVQLLRKLEVAQRFYLTGQFEHALTSAKTLLEEKWIDPIAGCLGGYLMLRLGKVGDLRVAAGNMVRYYAELPDSHVLKAEYEMSCGNNDNSKSSFLIALDKGIPLFADGLARTAFGIKKYNLDHPRRKLVEEAFENRVKGLLWTAWISNRRETSMETESAS